LRNIPLDAYVSECTPIQTGHYYTQTAQNKIWRPMLIKLSNPTEQWCQYEFQ